MNEVTKTKPAPQINPKQFEGEENGNPQEPFIVSNPQELTWQQYLVTEEPPDVPPLISIKDVPVCTPFNHSLLIGKKKTRKTLFLAWLISQYDGDINSDVLICDTEQGKKHVWKSRERIYKLTGKYINTLSLRGISPTDRRTVIEEAVKAGSYKILIVDGIRDLLSNINDPDQCTELVTWIERMTVTYSLHITNVLHQNKVDNNARGHIGSELLNKAEITIELELDEKAQCTIVKCESSRDIPFESFAFTHNEDGLPEVVAIPIKGQVMTDAERKNRLYYVFEGEILKRSEVITGIKEQFGVGENKAGTMLAEFVRLHWIMKDGRDKSPDAVYKLLTGIAKAA